MNTSPRLYDLTTDFTLGGTPRFSWKYGDNVRGAAQKSYKIQVSEDSAFSSIAWASGEVKSENTLYIPCGTKLKPCSEYFWRTAVTNNRGECITSEVQRFFTPLEAQDESAWHGAKWIGAPRKTVNPCGVKSYTIEASMSAQSAELAVNARNKDNCTVFSIDTQRGIVSVYALSDRARDENECTVKIPLGRNGGYTFDKRKRFKLVLSVNGEYVSLYIDNEAVISNERIMMKNEPNRPFCDRLYGIGMRSIVGDTLLYSMKCTAHTDTHGDCVLFDCTFPDKCAQCAVLGDVKNGAFVVSREMNIISSVPTAELFKLFDTDNIKSARLYSSAKGFYEVYINGARVGGDLYAPGFTDYRIRMYYTVHDVTDLIKSGENEIHASVAKGYYSGYAGYNSMPMVYGEQNTFIAMLYIEHTDGTTERIVTDNSWYFSPVSPIQSADYLDGEFIDARFKGALFNRKNWEKCGAYDWEYEAVPTNGTLDGLRFSLCPQIGSSAKIERELSPIHMHECPQGHFIYDFGQNITGTVRVKIKGERGTGIKLRYGEMCTDKIYLENLRTADCTDVYVCSGDDEGEEFVMSFTAHGFRYMEITGDGYVLTDKDIQSMMLSVKAIVVTNTPTVTGSFECSDERINKLMKNIEWGQRGNSLLVFTDCPQRNERMGWTGDAQVFAATAVFNMDIRTFGDKWLCDLRDAQLMYNRNGAVPDTAPLCGDNRPMGGCGGWGDAAVKVPWELYCAYGDIQVLRDNYDMAVKWVEYQNSDERRNFGVRRVDGEDVPEQSDMPSEPYIQCRQSRGDHLAYDETTPFILSATAYAAHSAELLSKIADVLGKKDDSIKYYELFLKIKRAFCEAWVQADGSIAYHGEETKNKSDGSGNIINRTYYSENASSRPSQTSYALAVDFGLINAHDAARYMKRALDDRGGKLSVGFLGISHLMPALTRCGLDEEAFSLLIQEDNPGWLYSVVNGATTIWERWNSYNAQTKEFGNAAMNSFNHYSYGAVGEWIYKHIAGINPLSPGYGKILLAPTVGGGMEYARAVFECPHGEIVSEWRVTGGGLEYKCKIPPCTEAIVVLPEGYGESVTEIGIFECAKKEKTRTYTIKSGEYTFFIS